MELEFNRISPFSPPFFFRRTNLQNFLSSVTPIVCSNDFQVQNDKNASKYFDLENLWDCYEEWSAYGVGVPIVLNSGETVTQYYVPYLSAIQIYTNSPHQTFRNLKEKECASPVEDETWSNKSENDKSSSNGSNKPWDGISTDESTNCCDSPSPDRERLGHFYFKYCDTCSPYWRTPFAEKIAELAEKYPALMTLNNVQLSPASWIAVAWYPIYHIPMNANRKDCLSTCFLTYHTLSASSQGVDYYEGENKKWNKACELGKRGGYYDNSGNLLYPFGLATYKLEEDVWINSHTYDDYETIIDLYSAADSWLKQLNFWHHDFNFFTSQFNMEG